MASLSEVESEIAALTKRHSDLDGRLARFGGIDHDVGQAMGVIDKQLRELQRRRTALLSGQPDPAATPSQLRPPRRLTSTKEREAADEVCKQAAETALAMPLDTPLQDLLTIYGAAGVLAALERDLLAFGKTGLPGGLPCEFSEKLYAGFLALVWQLTANVQALSHLQGNQRKLLAERVAALESRRQDLLNAAQMQLIEHRLLPIFETELAKAVASLLARVQELENRPSPKYLGVWEVGRQYAPGNFVTDRGSVFHANETTRDRPGDGKSWTLACKRGNDGKDFKHG